MVVLYKLKSKVIPYPGMGAWHFAYVDKSTSALIKEKHHKKKAGFGSIRVEAKVGKTSWKTSIFPDKQSGCYLLPIKRQVRAAEGIGADDIIALTLTI